MRRLGPFRDIVKAERYFSDHVDWRRGSCAYRLELECGHVAHMKGSQYYRIKGNRKRCAECLEGGTGQRT